PRLGSPSTVAIPLLDKIPVLGASVFTQPLLAYLGIAFAGLLVWVFRRTNVGLNLRAAGEKPEALDAAGISVLATRSWAALSTGMLAGLGGAYLSLGELNLYSEGMTAGRGFIALAAVIFGRWSPLGATGAALAFGALSALQFFLQRAAIPSELLQALPYLAALVALAGATGRVRAPASDGVPYAE
ncbi:MAG: ABC transporter permease, partial [Vulcanimicrobiaceae bacterium]